jgi:thioredoxin-related protein
MKTQLKIGKRVLNISIFLLVQLLVFQVSAAPRKRAPIKWPEAIEWLKFEEGQQRSAASGKPMLIVVYANWCTQCDALSKAMEDKKLVELSKSFVMVLADHDDQTQGFHHYTPKLTYVPRLLFMKPDGEFWVEMKSGNQRYPYFYQGSSLDQLLVNMNKSLSVHGKVK